MQTTRTGLDGSIWAQPETGAGVGNMPAESGHQIAISSVSAPQDHQAKAAETTPNKLRKNLKGRGEEKERTRKLLTLTSNPSNHTCLVLISSAQTRPDPGLGQFSLVLSVLKLQSNKREKATVRGRSLRTQAVRVLLLPLTYPPRGNQWAYHVTPEDEAIFPFLAQKTRLRW